MANTTQHTENDVIDFLTDIITLGDVNTIDNNPDRIIRYRESNKPMMHRSGEAMLPCAVYGTKASDVFVVNPFTMGSTADTSWFTISRINILGCAIVGIMKRIIDIGVDSKSKSKEAKDWTNAELEMASPFVSVCDDKMLKELDTITSKMEDFLSISYNKTKRISTFKCLIFSSVQRKAFPKIRVSTWNTFEEMLRTILRMSANEDLSIFDYSHSFHGADAFEGMTAILVDLYERATDLIEVVLPESTVRSKVTNLKAHLKYFGAYNATASWCRTPMVSNLSAHNPNVLPVQANGLPPIMPNGLPAYNSVLPRPTGLPQVGVPVSTIPAYSPAAYVPAPGIVSQGYYSPPVIQQSNLPMQAPMTIGVPYQEQQLPNVVSGDEIQSRNPFVQANNR